MTFKWLNLLFITSAFSLHADPTFSNVMIYKDGDVQVTSQLNTYENMIAGTVIKGSVLITHDSNELIDNKSFSLDGKPLKVEFVQTVQPSDASKLVLSIYQFQIPSLPAGYQTLAPIKVNVGGKVYEAPPLTLNVAPAAK